MPSPKETAQGAGLQERYSRQVILPGVGKEGQARWEVSRVLLAGEGPAFEAAATALRAVGVSQLSLLEPGARPEPIPADLALVVTEKADFRRALNRAFRKLSQPALFAWPAGSGYALYLTGKEPGRCPCLECFEVLNPKAFGRGGAIVQRMLGAMAASEALQWLLQRQSPLAGQVWITSLEGGISIKHRVEVSYKCPAHLLEQGAQVTP
jgi:hypothetical protein